MGAARFADAGRKLIASLTRRVTFAAAHRYWRSDWTDDRNRQLFGASTRLHGHNYACEVTVGGEIDPETGMVTDLGRLDAVLAAEVRERFDHKNINADVAEFGDGALVPTGENLARFIFERVQHALSNVRVMRVVVREDEGLAAEYGG
ncbi:MAG: 6-carboxytetrahydropterin synthase [Gemmatimonadota bacterium]|nr:6-carboxytetrahydropterin synthase [Gemmatimonadota bacterium]